MKEKEFPWSHGATGGSDSNLTNYYVGRTGVSSADSDFPDAVLNDLANETPERVNIILAALGFSFRVTGAIVGGVARAVVKFPTFIQNSLPIGDRDED